MPRAVALFSGGLDSALSIRLLQQQGFEVEALNIRTVFECCRTPAAQAAADLGVRLTVLSVADDYIEVIRNPSYGYGKGFNPCIDCRIYMCKMAGEFMRQTDACVVITGEVLGQRPMSQKRRDLDIVMRESGLNGRLLRPLSAKLLRPTIPEQEGLVDRERLHDFEGRRRSELIALARRLGLREIPQPSVGCALTQVTFAPRVRDLLQFHPHATRWDFELLSLGRHIRVDERTKIVVGRNADENALLRLFFRREDASKSALLEPENFLGPDVLILGGVTDESIELAAALMHRYTRRLGAADRQVRVTHAGATRLVSARPLEAAQAAQPM